MDIRPVLSASYTAYSYYSSYLHPHVQYFYTSTCKYVSGIDESARYAALFMIVCFAFLVCIIAYRMARAFFNLVFSILMIFLKIGLLLIIFGYLTNNYERLLSTVKSFTDKLDL